MKITYSQYEVQAILETHVLNLYDIAEKPLSTALCNWIVSKNGEIEFVINTAGPYETLST
jgi:hypothetical protein